MGITLKCRTCPLASACVKSGGFTPPKVDAYLKLNLTLESWRRSPPDIKLPRLIPEMPLEDPVKPRKDLGMGGVIVSISKLDSENMKKVEEEGIHNFLDFDGQILLSTIMPDRLLTEETFNFTVGFAKRGGFDGVIGWDMPVYADYPKALNLSNLVKAMLLTMGYVEEGMPMIPLLKGGDSSEIALHSEWLRKLGFRRIGLHATEYVLARSRGAKVHEDLTKIADDLYSLGLLKIYEIGAKPLMIGALGLKGLHDLYKSDVEASLTGMSWLLEARSWHAYAGTPSGVDLIDLGRELMECNCEACSGKPPNQIAENPNDIAWHNWVLLKEYAEKGELHEVSVYDMILGEDDCLAVVGDLHIGVPQSLWLPCLRRLKKIHPTHLVLLGDVFDFVKGKPKASHVISFLDLLKNLGVCMRYVSGCSDSSAPRFLKALMRFAFTKGPREPQLYNPNPMLVEAMRSLTMLYRFSKSRIRVKLADRKVVTLSHGHELGFRMDASPEEVMKRLLENKDSKEIRVIGHYHKSLYEPEERGVMLSAWRTITPEEREMGLPPDIADILIIKGDGSMELLKGM
ncbi:MAG: metallophosphoesterase family protein [Thermoproteota archaeon]|nr:metallophosphoesterase family protein [Candidatus Brockarchaeota archaeon]